MSAFAALRSEWTDPSSERLEQFCRQAPPLVDTEAVRRAWMALSPDYDVNQWRLPLPLWAKRPYEDSGLRAWEILQGDLGRAATKRPFCIYAHIPFCVGKCSFCDSYSFKLGSHREETSAAYVDRLRYELALWARLEGLRGRPVSTVHLGGGTPTFLGETQLTRLIEGIRELFDTSPTTEWALESTAEALTPTMLATMDGLGFRRLHIGVQTLEDPVRLAIGRPGTAAEVLSRVEASLALGWVVSVDLLCGLPEQTLAGFIGGIETLMRAGIDGFSLYELLIYPQNHRWAESLHLTERSHLPNYFLFLAGAGLLEARGYAKNVFNHWAGPRDANVYFTFPTRGEDCLAVGTIADGVFGDYHFRHPRYAKYLQTAHSGSPGLEGGLRRTARESRLRPLVTALLSGHFRAEDGAELATREGRSLVERWQANGLMEPDSGSGLRLTASGAWFAGNLVAELEVLRRDEWSGRGDEHGDTSVSSHADRDASSGGRL